jgi:hypothetical protein
MLRWTKPSSTMNLQEKGTPLSSYMVMEETIDTGTTNLRRARNEQK